LGACLARNHTTLSYNDEDTWRARPFTPVVKVNSHKGKRELRNPFFVGLKYLNSSMRIRDIGWKKIGSGINIPDPQECMKCNVSSLTVGQTGEVGQQQQQRRSTTKELLMGRLKRLLLQPSSRLPSKVKSFLIL
jgi:hypothetical protein